MLRKSLIVVFIASLFIFPMSLSAELINFTASDQYLSTAGFEMNAYDWLLNPVYYGLLDTSTLFFAFDASAQQLGATTAGNGFRGGYAWIMPGFSPLFMLDYRTTASGSSQDETQNVQLSYSGYDLASGGYATITESANIVSNNILPAQKLIAFFGGKLDSPIGFDVHGEWLFDKTTQTALSYTNTYSNTASPTDATLTSKGNQTDTTIDLRNNTTNALAIESDVGLNFDFITSRISLGTGLFNWDFTPASWTQTVTMYSAGLDPTVRDQETDTIYSGAYYYASSVATPNFAMNTNTPNYLPNIPLSLDSLTTLNFDPTFKLEIPVSATITFVPDASTVATSTMIAYNDSLSSDPEIERSETTTTNSLAYDRNLTATVGGTVRKAFQKNDSAVLYLGAGLAATYTGWEVTRSSTQGVHTQIDTNGNGNYTDAGTDIDTLYTKSGWEIKNSNDQISTVLSVPLAASYTPVKGLTFHAGTVTSMTVYVAFTSSLTTGDPGYVYETYTDNLVPANSYAQRTINLSANSNTPVNSTTWGFSFSVSGNFGVTLQLADNFTVDALASGSSVGFSSFSLTGAYAF